MADESGKRSFLGTPMGIGLIALVVIALVAGGYFFLYKPDAGTAGAGITGADGQTSAASGTCGVALNRVRDYGVVPSNTELSGSKDGASADGKTACEMRAGETNYAVLVDVTCNDTAKAECFAIHSVTQGTGEVLYQQRPFAY